MVDLHSHVLPGLDDGAANLDEALLIVRAMAAEGVRIVAATPHVSERYQTTPAAMEAALALVRGAVRDEGLEIEVHGGGELTAEKAATLDEETLTRFGLGGNPRALLVECPYHGWSSSLTQVLDGLLARGIWAVLAHPERNPVVQESPRVLAPLVEGGLLVQLTAASVDGRLGRAPAKCAQTLLREGLAHMIASDAHTPSLRACGLVDAVVAVGDDVLADWLIEDVPAAVVNGEAPPTRPAKRSRRRRFFG